MDKDVKYKKIIYIRSQSADPSPPLGTVLGNIGVNTVNFCTGFNAYTKGLPNYFLLKVYINIFENRSFIFSVALPSLGFMLNLIKFERTIKVKVNDRFNDKLIVCVKLYPLLQLLKLKLKLINFNTLLMVKGTVKSMNIIIVNN